MREAWSWSGVYLLAKLECTALGARAELDHTSDTCRGAEVVSVKTSYARKHMSKRKRKGLCRVNAVLLYSPS